MTKNTVVAASQRWNRSPSSSNSLSATRLPASLPLASATRPSTPPSSACHGVATRTMLESSIATSAYAGHLQSKPAIVDISREPVPTGLG
ncbi:hypothetical protein K470DRAFT_103502 [Piedraia hortae CBS 480.64]|uniref:Uncharacterized protein n=1 Tax=Piedraia hortae CBS 480.64 TaxID=1314780 RepID=A0A6A7CA72_9PEZI|nr:hypothetical protein K470DRAFT_103502 [Piedraia hortae CBS 480.64]